VTVRLYVPVMCNEFLRIMYDIGGVIDNVYVDNVNFCVRTRSGFKYVAENQNGVSILSSFLSSTSSADARIFR
jgi:hypothetical protein